MYSGRFTRERGSEALVERWRWVWCWLHGNTTRAIDQEEAESTSSELLIDQLKLSVAANGDQAEPSRIQAAARFSCMQEPEQVTAVFGQGQVLVAHCWLSGGLGCWRGL